VASLCILVLRCFSYTNIHPSALTADGDVSAKISEEIAYEKESAVEGEPEFLQEFKKTGIWTVCPFLSFILRDLICMFFSC
jgi:hypothetical protein